MLRYMLDTNFCIRLLRDRPQGLREKFNAEVDAMCISTVVLSELLYGADKSGNPAKHRTQVEGFAERLAVLPFDQPAAAHTGNIRAVLAKSGSSIGPYDSMIAGHARSIGLTVITGNLGEFRRVEGLLCEDWKA